MAADFVSALKEAWEADATLTAAGIGDFHYGVDPGGEHPYVVVTSLGTKITHRNFGKGQLHEYHYRVNVFSGDPDGAAALGAVARTFLESVQATPLTFDDGRQVDFHQTGEDLVVLRKPGSGAQPFVWVKSSTWTAKIARDRV
jgi:hypothetical protein